MPTNLLGNTPANGAVSLSNTSSPTLRLGGRTAPNTTGTLLADPSLMCGGRWSYA